ncbi:hypothetical protein L6255_03130 [Candidatus Parcubacteria bacterium]|nr:hypothetical protein [Patescibacteria group bacterium]MCG2689405.1 hypothetical protein [Candidatus Parcubacteria bacterium]
MTSKNLDSYPLSFLVLSIAFTIFAIIGAVWQDIYLASTQWTLLAILSATWGLYFKKS